MKKITLHFSILAVSSFLLLGCNKKDNVAPEPDTEFQSSKDVTYAAEVITDIDIITSFVGENNYVPKFYMPAANATGTVTVNRDTLSKYLIIQFNNTQCVDGHLRDGTIFVNYSPSTQNAKYYRDFAFKGSISLTNYRVDGWYVKLLNTGYITNKITPYNYDPKKTNLSWGITGDFKLENPVDTTKNMHLNVDLVKTLTSTSNPSVFAVSKQSAINWTITSVAYTGSMHGETSRTVPFNYKIDDSQPLVRDFTCFPDKVAGVSVGQSSVTPHFEEFHPFINGAASFTTAALYPRVIHYGAEDNSTPQCDNVGIITIKGISYPIDFKKAYPVQ